MTIKRELILDSSSNQPGLGFVQRTGDTMTGPLVKRGYITDDVDYGKTLNGADPDADGGLYFYRPRDTEGYAPFQPALVLDTATGGAWAVASKVTGENLQLLYATPEEVANGEWAVKGYDVAPPTSLRNLSNAVVSVSRSGTTFTATRAAGTTFTFTQQDNNSFARSTANYTGTTAALAANATQTVSVSGTAPTGVGVGQTAIYTNHNTVVIVNGNNGNSVYCANRTATARDAKYATVTRALVWGHT